MTIADSPTYLSEPSVDRAYSVIQQAAQDVLGGMTSQPIRVAFEERRALAPDAIAALGANVLVEMQFERPAEVHHGVVILAGAADLTRLFELPSSSTDSTDSTDEVIDAESLLSLGDIVSTFLDSLVGELTWLRPTPRAWLANLEPLPATGAVLPDLVARDEPLYVAAVTLTGADGQPCRLHVVFGEGAERALLGLDPGAEGVDDGELDGGVDTAGASAASSYDEAPTARGGTDVASRQRAPVQTAQFKPLGPEQAGGRGQSIDLIKDVPLHVSVELGRASMTVREILALGPSSVVQLDRLAGEPVDILVNDRLIAHGEVVIVDESFGVRITEIVREAGRRSAP